ncbi:C-reactive protein-like [Dicentrarchus labrax]|uniref:Pentraxin family member n=1 Tax=Dicentrarchus labrax TaxID=13489 RepID=A0A8C4HUZ1_DICLA|nr:C-reactive protein-like [Dicentrarchus labrax]
MEQLLFLLALLCTAHAAQQDLSEKVFTFPLDKGAAAVRLTASIEQPITALTVCMRFYSTQTRPQSLFSLAVPSESNAFLLYKPSMGVYRLHIKGTALDIKGLPDNTDEWNSVCWTWESSSGLTTLWVNEKRSARKILERRTTLNGPPSIILGQDQDSYGGGFDPNQSFVGDITDVHLWDSVIIPCEIRFYMEGYAFTPGNLLNWKNLQYSTNGSVYVERSDFDKLTCY